MITLYLHDTCIPIWYYAECAEPLGFTLFVMMIIMIIITIN